MDFAEAVAHACGVPAADFYLVRARVRVGVRVLGLGLAMVRVRVSHG